MKKKILILIIAIIIILALGVGIVAILKNKNTNKDTLAESENNVTNEASEEENLDDGRYMHDYFDTTKFDKNKFTGIVYDENGNELKVVDLLNELKSEGKSKFQIAGYDYFTKDKSREKELTGLNNNNTHSDDDLEMIKEILGDPSGIYERYAYFQGDENENTGSIGLIYDYDDYVIDVLLQDFSHWKNDTYTSPYIMCIYVKSKEQWFYEIDNNKTSYMDHKLYGEEVKR